MFDARDLEFFNFVASGHSLAAAARNMNITASAVSQRLKSLEHRMGAQLIDRRSRRLTLTEEGRLVAAEGKILLAQLDSLRDVLAERRQQIVGRLRIAAPFGFGRRHIAPIVASFCKSHPDVSVDLTLSDQTVGKGEDAWDLAIHIGDLSDCTASLSARRLAPNDRFLCASSEYLTRAGEPAQVNDLAKHLCIVIQENAGDGAVWRLRSAQRGRDEVVRVEPRLVTNDGEIARAWALAGQGVMLRSEWDVAEDLRSGKLSRVLEKHTGPAGDIFALFPSSPQARPARTRLFLEHLVRALRPVPWRTGTGR
jgi:DNA-binding transcriptional LysR family regulator